MLRKRASLVAVLSVALLIALAVAAYGYDTTRDDLIADGVTVAGVDVGGMRADDATSKFRETLGPGLERPVRVAAAGRRLKLTAERAHLVADVDGMVDEALEVSRDGGLPARVWRGPDRGRGRQGAGGARHLLAGGREALRAARAAAGEPAAA